MQYRHVKIKVNQISVFICCHVSDIYFSVALLTNVNVYQNELLRKFFRCYSSGMTHEFITCSKFKLEFYSFYFYLSFLSKDNFILYL